MKFIVTVILNIVSTVVTLKFSVLSQKKNPINIMNLPPDRNKFAVGVKIVEAVQLFTHDGWESSHNNHGCQLYVYTFMSISP